MPLPKKATLILVIYLTCLHFPLHSPSLPSPSAWLPPKSFCDSVAGEERDVTASVWEGTEVLGNACALSMRESSSRPVVCVIVQA